MSIPDFDPEGLFAPEVDAALRERSLKKRFVDSLVANVRTWFNRCGMSSVHEAKFSQYDVFSRGQAKLTETCRERNFLGHGVGSAFQTTRQILIDGKLEHRKGDIQYGNLGDTGANCPHDHGKGLFIPKLHYSNGILFTDLPDGSSIVPLRKIEWIVLEPNAVDEIRSEIGRSILVALGVTENILKKIFSHSELADLLESMPNFGVCVDPQSQSQQLHPLNEEAGRGGDQPDARGGGGR